MWAQHYRHMRVQIQQNGSAGIQVMGMWVFPVERFQLFCMSEVLHTKCWGEGESARSLDETRYISKTSGMWQKRSQEGLFVIQINQCGQMKSTAPSKLFLGDDHCNNALGEKKFQIIFCTTPEGSQKF